MTWLARMELWRECLQEAGLALTAWPVIVGWDIWAGHKPFVSAAAIFATFITGSMSLVAMAEYLPGVTLGPTRLARFSVRSLTHLAERLPAEGAGNCGTSGKHISVARTVTTRSPGPRSAKRLALSPRPPGSGSGTPPTWCGGRPMRCSGHASCPTFSCGSGHRDALGHRAPRRPVRARGRRPGPGCTGRLPLRRDQDWTGGGGESSLRSPRLGAPGSDDRDRWLKDECQPSAVLGPAEPPRGRITTMTETPDMNDVAAAALRLIGAFEHGHSVGSLEAVLAANPLGIATALGLLASPVAFTVQCTACSAPVKAVACNPVAAIRPGLHLVSEQPRTRNREPPFMTRSMIVLGVGLYASSRARLRASAGLSTTPSSAGRRARSGTAATWPSMMMAPAAMAFARPGCPGSPRPIRGETWLWTRRITKTGRAAVRPLVCQGRPVPIPGISSRGEQRGVPPPG